MTDISCALVSALASFAVTCAVTPFIGKLAKRFGIVAVPGGRRHHLHTTPLLGGVGMFSGVFLSVLGFVLYFNATGKHPISSLYVRQITGVLAGGALVAAAGVLDDKYELSGKVQLAVMIAAGFVLSLFNVTVGYISTPWIKDASLMALPAVVGILTTVIWTVMVTKAVDCIDGMDGLCAGFSFITSATFTLMALCKAGSLNTFVIPLSASVAGASLGFLVYNFPPAKLFMGTVGSQFLGFMLASISVMGAYKVTIFGILAPILVLGIPVFDTTYVVLKRVSEKKNIGEADRNHIHHRLSDHGNSVKKVLLIIYLLTLVLCAVAFYLYVKG
ncbi:MAG: undecaprenyl/decaprenyl-phosphate alpha-N-acetylglucosaminyl 1-phosphate transferase [Abditibacteriota bacterium]|nr:undecaprenyl/decaprenyl-phosphate alpha-N-acetylglucosaminyl 1-phosphate transferase [Abditibacteriota bacterium]